MIVALSAPKLIVGTKLLSIKTLNPIHRMSEEDIMARPLVKITLSSDFWIETFCAR